MSRKLSGSMERWCSWDVAWCSLVGGSRYPTTYLCFAIYQKTEDLSCTVVKACNFAAVVQFEVLSGLVSRGWFPTPPKFEICALSFGQDSFPQKFS